MKKRKLLVALTVLLTISFSVNSQNFSKEILYKRYINGNPDSSYHFSLKFYNGIAYLSNANDQSQVFIDFKNKLVVDVINYNDVNYKTVKKFTELTQPKFVNETETILGFKCNKAIYKAFSNTIEVWYTKATKFKGAPYKDYFPDNSLVLKVLINGSREVVASEIKDFLEVDSLSNSYVNAKEITEAEYREFQIKSRFVTIPVFNKQQINFEGNIENQSFGKVNTTYRFSKGTVILKKVQLPQLTKEGASIFATLTNWSNGDAYDRTCSLFTISSKKEKSVLDAFKNGLNELPVIKDNKGNEYQGVVSTDHYSVPIELMRFFTSFGVSHFNKKREINNYKWQDSVVYKQEITNLIPNDEDEIWLGVFIGNYDKGGHKVSLELNFYPAWEQQKQKIKYINPLFSTINILEMSGQNYGRMFKNDTLKATFTVPESIENLQLLYTTTGHGGWGNGDEFNPKLNQVFIDGKLVFSHVPWRTDCATYRLSNPASGNFQNGLSSSDLSRSNWCPATLTPPYFIPLKNLKEGKHTIEVVIDQGDDEGSSFNHWGVSGVLIGNYKEQFVNNE